MAASDPVPRGTPSFQRHCRDSLAEREALNEENEHRHDYALAESDPNTIQDDETMSDPDLDARAGLALKEEDEETIEDNASLDNDLKNRQPQYTIAFGSSTKILSPVDSDPIQSPDSDGLLYPWIDLVSLPHSTTTMNTSTHNHESSMLTGRLDSSYPPAVTNTSAR